jgi:REP element-mobilizing transposase RayT
MSHSYTSLLTHVVFSTKDRKPFIDAALEARLFPYFGGVVRQLGGKLYTVNGVEDHVHLLVDLPPSLAVAEAVGKIKGGATHWIHETFSERAAFS